MCQYVERPAVTDDVVHGGEEEVFLPFSRSNWTHQGTLRQVERLTGRSRANRRASPPAQARENAQRSPRSTVQVRVGVMACMGRPSTSTKVVRKASWRR